MHFHGLPEPQIQRKFGKANTAYGYRPLGPTKLFSLLLKVNALDPRKVMLLSQRSKNDVNMKIVREGQAP